MLLSLWLLLTQFESVFAVYIEVVVAGLALPTVGVKDETVWAGPLLGNIVVAFVVSDKIIEKKKYSAMVVVIRELVSWERETPYTHTHTHTHTPVSYTHLTLSTIHTV